MMRTRCAPRPTEAYPSAERHTSGGRNNSWNWWKKPASPSRRTATPPGGVQRARCGRHGQAPRLTMIRSQSSTASSAGTHHLTPTAAVLLIAASVQTPPAAPGSWTRPRRNTPHPQGVGHRRLLRLAAKGTALHVETGRNELCVGGPLDEEDWTGSDRSPAGLHRSLSAVRVVRVVSLSPWQSLRVQSCRGQEEPWVDLQVGQW